ncbi:DUF4113 domain-containing protein [Leptolyngbya sp. FACHB-60]|uniref:DUF4113 domain-containing protein n=1 Tax=Cyanophyceae TaxID=3028117 RepID=UPI00321FBFE8
MHNAKAPPTRSNAPIGKIAIGTLDSLNRKLSLDAVKFGAMSLKPTWAMRSKSRPSATWLAGARF